MDFDIKKPTHIFSFLLIVITFFIFIILPILSFLGIAPASNGFSIQDIYPEFQFFFELILLLIQLTLVFILFILFPLIWYYFINEYNLKKIFSILKLRKENINYSILWSFITVIIAFVIITIIGLLFQLLNFDLSDSSNIIELEQYFSVPTIIILIIIQPLGEEIFFRGFLLDKFNNLFGKYPAIIVTSLLFGIAHLSYGNIYPAILTSFIGLILGLLVIRTNNLYSAIIAHVIFNIASYSFYLIAKSMQILPLIL